MNLRNFKGIMARRLLVNWRVDPVAAARVLPPGLKPALVNNHAVIGLCLVRLEHLRPTWLPSLLGLASENLAVRMGVVRRHHNQNEKSVLIFRRESPSFINGLFCHHIGYGVHHPGQVRAKDSPHEVRITGGNDFHHYDVLVQNSTAIHPNSAFTQMSEAEQFFRGSECGYSPTRTPGWWDAVKLHLDRWELHPMHVAHARSTIIDRLFGPSATPDSAFIMRDIPHTWTPSGRVHLGQIPAPTTPRSRRDQSKIAQRFSGGSRAFRPRPSVP